MYFGAQSLFYYLLFASYMVLGLGWQTTGTIVTDVAPAHRRGEALAIRRIYESADGNWSF